VQFFIPHSVLGNRIQTIELSTSAISNDLVTFKCHISYEGLSLAV